MHVNLAACLAGHDITAAAAEIVSIGLAPTRSLWSRLPAPLTTMLRSRHVCLRASRLEAIQFSPTRKLYNVFKVAFSSSHLSIDLSAPWNAKMVSFVVQLSSFYSICRANFLKFPHKILEIIPFPWCKLNRLLLSASTFELPGRALSKVSYKHCKLGLSSSSIYALNIPNELL